MKTLIFSDTHLSLPFEEKKYNFMRGIIEPVDKVVINGDFWENNQISFQQFVDSPWKNLFPLLKQKHAIYIYGNHDTEECMDANMSLFSDVQTYRHTMKLKDKELVIEHGNRLHAFIDEAFHMERIKGTLTKPYSQVEYMMVRRTGKLYLKLLNGPKNNSIKKKLKTELKRNQIYICGHTHYAEVDKSSHFVNSGIIRHGLGQYLMVENHGIEAKEEWYD
ncbi:MAG: metallophosphoesterase family protein [Patescibacteria group bacterium]